MHQFNPRPHWGFTAPPDPLAGFQEREGEEERRGEERGRNRKGCRRLLLRDGYGKGREEKKRKGDKGRRGACLTNEKSFPCP